tara:strand:- start:168 stop:503 length:336 start_codon:yes stop_codon:yes gene_type:complete
MTRTRLTNRERFEIESLIAQHGDETEIGWQYHDGWSDEKISKHCNATQKTISAIRGKTFGNLASHASRSSGKMFEVFEKLEILERRLDALENQYTAPESASNGTFLTQGAN